MKNTPSLVARCVIQFLDLVAYEDLKVRNLVKNHCLAKSITDAGWYQFRQWVERFGQKMGKVTVAVPPHYTSQECSKCGTIVKKSLSTRTHKCACGCELDRDFNAAINILKRGLSTVGHTGTWINNDLNAWGEGTATCVEATQYGQVRDCVPRIPVYDDRGVSTSLTITAGRVLPISAPTVGSSFTKQTSPLRMSIHVSSGGKGVGGPSLTNSVPRQSLGTRINFTKLLDSFVYSQAAYL